jgi:two-component system, OmpR family, phosphate regulon sensor histidine kinase PhoR
MNLRWTIKILGVFTLVIALIIIPSTIYLGSNLKTFLMTQKEEDLKRDLKLAVWILADHLSPNQNDPPRVRQLTEQLGYQLGKRLTLLSKDGRVIGDSVLNRDRLDKGEDFSNRPEILAMKTKGYGQIVRFSPEMQANTLFGAAPILKEGILLGYIRIALPLSPIEKAVAYLRLGLFLAGGLMLILAGLISLLLSRNISKPIREITDMVQRMNQGDLKQPFHLLAQIEIKALAASLESLAAGLTGKMDLLETETGELKTLLSSMREGVLVTDEKGRIILINPFLNKVLGGKVSWKKRSVQEAFMSAELQDAVEAVLKGDPFQRMQFFFGRDLQRHFEVQVLALTSTHRPPRAVAIFHETTELRYLLKVRQAFVANASWELDNPLKAINGRLDNLLPMIPADLPEVRQNITSIHTEVKRLCLLVSDMLDLAKLDVQEKGNKNYGRVIIQELLRTVGDMIKDQALGKNIIFDQDIENLPEGITAFWEKDRVMQALFNILDNAVKYTPKGGQIHLTANLISDFRFPILESDTKDKFKPTPQPELRNPQPTIKISVKDTGIGIPLEHLPRIFERFYRVDREYSRQLGGTGLGLAIVKHIIESHGGTVEVQTMIGRGSTFTIKLPLEPEWLSSKDD